MKYLPRAQGNSAAASEPCSTPAQWGWPVVQDMWLLEDVSIAGGADTVPFSSSCFSFLLFHLNWQIFVELVYMQTTVLNTNLFFPTGFHCSSVFIFTICRVNLNLYSSSIKSSFYRVFLSILGNILFVHLLKLMILMLVSGLEKKQLCPPPILYFK